MISTLLYIAYLWIAIAIDDYFTPERCKLISRQKL